MLKRYTFWFSAAAVLQLITGLIHSVSLFVGAEPANDSERQLQSLLTTYRFDAGGGFHPTYENLFTALSSCFTFLCIFAALSNGYLLRKHVGTDVMKGLIAINLVIFGGVFAVMAYLTFPPPIICSGLIFVSLIPAFILVPKIETAFEAFDEGDL